MILSGVPPELTALHPEEAGCWSRRLAEGPREHAAPIAGDRTTRADGSANGKAGPRYPKPSVSVS